MSTCTHCGCTGRLRRGLCHTEYERRRRAGADWSLVPAQPAREHIAVLRAAGWRYNEISRATGLDSSAITAIARGREKVNTRTSAAICIVLPATRAQFVAHVDPAIIAARVRRAAASLTPEVKAERSRKIWATRRANKAKQAAEPAADRRAIPTPPPLPTRMRRVHHRPLALLAELVLPRQDWREDALCTQVDSEMFFPEKGGSTREAKQVCSACPVRTECLRFAIDNEEQHGIWGGMSQRERAGLRRRAA
jgi:WhiB family redox-sensing transcriptional regulator